MPAGDWGTRPMPSTPIQQVADSHFVMANEIVSLKQEVAVLQSELSAQVAANQVLLEQVAGLKKQVVKWRPASEVDQCEFGKKYVLTWVHYGETGFEIASLEQNTDDFYLVNKDGWKCNSFDYFCALEDLWIPSQFPLPATGETK